MAEDAGEIAVVEGVLTSFICGEQGWVTIG